MSNASLLGTPLPSSSSRQRERSAAPSPYTPFRASRDQTPTERSVTPAARHQSTSSSSHSQTPASPTLSTTSTSQTSPNTAVERKPNSMILPSQDELRQQARNHVNKSRILTDPSLSSCFKKEVDEELWNLFVGP